MGTEYGLCVASCELRVACRGEEGHRVGHRSIEDAGEDTRRCRNQLPM